MQARSSVTRYRFKRLVETLSSKRGYGTELISLYIPPGKRVSDVTNHLRQEYSTASNIKSPSTRKNVLDALTKVIQHVKLLKEIPKNGLAIFCGSIPQNGPGSERIEFYSLIPPEPIGQSIYRCDSAFYLEPLREMLVEKDVYGVMVMDCSGATYALLTGRRLEIVKEITSGVPGKHRAGGQSARRFERWREFEIHEYYKRAGEHANRIFLAIPNLKGIFLGGPGQTKYDFKKGDHLHYMLRDNILSIVDTSYTGEQGAKEVVSKVPDILRDIQYVKERQLLQKFFHHIGHNTGMAVYGEEEVRKALNKGIVEALLLSEALRIIRFTLKCLNCGYTEEGKATSEDMVRIEEETSSRTCPSCTSTSLALTEKRSLLEEFIDLGERKKADVEIVSTETEEGEGLINSFGGIAAILWSAISKQEA